MFCEKCGTRLDDSTVFCTACGNKVMKPVAPEVPAPTPVAENAHINEFKPEMAPVAHEVPAEPAFAPAPQSTSEAQATQFEPTNADNRQAFSSNNYKQSNNQSANYQSSNYQSSNYKSNNNAGSVPPTAFGGDVHHVPASTYYADPKAGKTKSNKWLVVTIIICSTLLVVLASVFAYNILTKDDANDIVDGPGIEESQNEDDDDIKSDGEIAEPDEVIINEIDEEEIVSIISANSDYTDFGIYVRNLENGYEFGYNENQVFNASAMCQVVILDALSNAADEKDLDIEYESIYYYHLEQNGKEAPDSKYDDGTYVYINDCVEDIAIYGDNNKSNLLVDYLGEVYGKNGFNVINKYLKNSGYSNTQINRNVYTGPNSHLIDEYADPNVTTPKEISEIFHNLITNCNYGSENYMSAIFQPIDTDNNEVGIRKYIDPQYTVASVNGVNTQSSNDVAIVSNGETKVLVSILCYTEEGRTNVETYKTREYVQDLLIDYILETQFE